MRYIERPRPRLHCHRGRPDVHPTSQRHSADPVASWAHYSEITRWRRRKGHRPKWAQAVAGEGGLALTGLDLEVEFTLRARIAPQGNLGASQANLSEMRFSVRGCADGR